MSTAGVILNEFTVPTLSSQPMGITAGPSSNIWFTERNANKVGVVTTGGVFGEYALPAGSHPTDITLGSDGNFYVAEPGINRIARVTPSGTVTQADISGLTAGAQPTSITAGQDGNLWFTEPGLDRIGRMTTGGTVTEFILPGGAAPADIVAGQDGNLWFTEPGTNKIGRINPSGSNVAIAASITHFDAGLSASASPRAITAGADGNLWFAEQDGDRIGRITTALDPPQFESPDPLDINGLAADLGANPYPSTITVTGLGGPINSVKLRLTGLSHTFPDDIDILLTSPSGQTLRVMSDNGGGGLTPADAIGTAVNGVTFNVTNGAVASIPDRGPLVSGRFQPGFGTGSSTWPAPAPAGPYTNFPQYFSVFNGDLANGTWKLWVNDDAGADTGKIFGGWGLDIDTEGFANNDTITRPEDSSPTLRNVLANDTGSPLEIVAVSDPAHGTATIIDGNPDEIDYGPDPNYCNSPGGTPDVFTYELSTGSIGTVSATVTCSPDPSVANDDSRTVLEDSGANALTVLSNDTDVDGEPIDITGVTDPAHGTATVIQGSPDIVSYSPDPDYCNDGGPADALTYTVGGGDTAIVSVAVICVDEPVILPPPAPQTTITKAPKKLKAKGKSAKATFEFSSSIAGSSFECALDGAAPRSCASPTTVKAKKGKHTFTVVATAAGVKDPTPATAAFRVKPKKK